MRRLRCVPLEGDDERTAELKWFPRHGDQYSVDAANPGAATVQAAADAASPAPNDISQPIEAATVMELLRAEGVDPGRRGVAVALNGEVVGRKDWAEAVLSVGDEVEIVKPFAGG